VLIKLQVLANGALAQLPTQADPDSGTIRDGNIIDAVKYYAKDIFLVAGLIIATVIFILVTTNAISVYKEIRDGRRTWGDLGMHAGAGAVLIVFVVFLLTQAQDIIV
jgi:integrating conjugative element membrane protein (TIGR03745 family)